MKDMNKQDIIYILDKSLNMPIGDVSDEWKAPSVVVGESDGVPFVQTRAESKDKVKELRDQVKNALSEKYVIVQGFTQFNSVDFRFWQNLKIIKEKPQK